MDNILENKLVFNRDVFTVGKEYKLGCPKIPGTVVVNAKLTAFYEEELNFRHSGDLLVVVSVKSIVNRDFDIFEIGDGK